MQKIAKNYTAGGVIDMPQSQGVVYYETCRTCLVDWEESMRYGSEECRWCHYLPSFVRLIQNNFYNNWESVNFFEQHDLPRASHFMSDGGAYYNITGNTFDVDGAIFDVLAEAELPSYTNYLPN